VRLRRGRPVWALLACAAAAALADAQDQGLADDLVVRQLNPGVWLHVTFRPEGQGGRVAANGLLVTTGEVALLIDTGWTVDQTRRILEWSERTLGQPVEHVIITHAHPDRMGGLDALRDRPIIVHGHALTSAKLTQNGLRELDWTFEFEERLDIGGEQVHLLYPGPGHSRDNIVVWLPRRRTLFAGCLVLDASARDLGPSAAPELRAWPLALRRIIERYRDVAILVPGHGRPGGVELLSHTMEILEQANGRGP
jgi:metallo-beta-lactamase class B